MANHLTPSMLPKCGRTSGPPLKRRRGTAGFTLLEMLVGIVLMVVLGGMVFSLFAKHARVYTLQQEVTELNLGLRSGLDMISADLMNAGANLSIGGYQRFPFPVIVQKNANGNFDKITVYQGFNDNDADDFTPATTLTTSTGVDPGGPIPISSATLYINPAPFPGLTQTQAATQTAAMLPSGTFVVIVNTDLDDPNLGQIAPLTLTGASTTATCNGNPCVILSTGGATNLKSGLLSVPASKVGTGFPFGSMVVKLAPPVSYSVDTTTDPLRPALVRTTMTSATYPNGTPLQLVSNLLTFSQRAWLQAGMFDDPALYPTPNDFSLIESLEINLVGRTQSNNIDNYRSAIDPTQAFRINSLTTTVALRNKVN